MPDLFISIAPSECVGIRAVLCYASCMKAEQGEPRGREITREDMIRCSRWINQAGWENNKDTALEYKHLSRGKKKYFRRSAM